MSDSFSHVYMPPVFWLFKWFIGIWTLTRPVSGTVPPPWSLCCHELNLFCATSVPSLCVSASFPLVKVCPPWASSRTFYPRDPSRRASPPSNPRAKTGFATSIITVSHPICALCPNQQPRRRYKTVKVFVDLSSLAAVFFFPHFHIQLGGFTLCSGHKFGLKLFGIWQMKDVEIDFFCTYSMSSGDSYRFYAAERN